MNEIQEQTERVDELVKKVFRKLDKRNHDLAIKIIQDIKFSYDKSFFGHQVSGHAMPINKNNTKFIIFLNLFRLKIFTDEAIIGVIAHEIGHCIDLYTNVISLKFRHFIFSIGFKNMANKWLEKNADNIAISLGFKENIDTLRRENIVHIDEIILEPKFKINEDGKRTWMEEIKISLKCENCDKDYNGLYFYDTNECFVNLFNNDVVVGQSKSINPVSEDKLIKTTKCPNCRKCSLKIKDKIVVSSMTI